MAAPVSAQSPAEQEVLKVVHQMFDGMRNADSAAVRAVFVPGARFASIDARATPPSVRYDSVSGWIAGIAGSNKRWNEQIYEVQVKVDGDMAHVWSPYTFYLDGKWNHCGVNSMELLKVNGAWKLTQLSDTRKREACRDPLGGGPRQPMPPGTPAPVSPSSTEDDDKAIRAVVNVYFRGHATANADTMRASFHPTAHIEGIRNGQFVSWTVDQYVANFRGQPATDEASRTRVIDVVDRVGTAAMVKATLRHGATTFTDYFVLLKIDGTWRIANKVYHAAR
jgi:hypothetical protein